MIVPICSMVNYQMISSKKFQKILLKHCKAVNRKVVFGVVRFLATSFGGAHNDEMRAEGFANISRNKSWERRKYLIMV